MTNKSKLLTMLILSSSAVAGIAMINKGIKLSSTSKNILKEPESCCYHWRFGNIYYTKSGAGKPLLLIHNLDAASSSYEWHQIISHLQKDYTVYAIDLLGCGRSEKPCLTYTNYLYVQLLTDFIKSEIGHRADVIASGESAALAVMACSHNPELFNRLMLVNPDSLLTCSQMPGKYARFYKGLLDFPVIGTLLYHIASSKQALRELFAKKYFYNPYAVRDLYLNAYYEAAHLGLSPKSVYASVRCNYTKANITKAIKKIDNSIYLLGGSGIENMKELLKEYTVYNPAIEYSLLPDTRYLPQVEKPNEFVLMVKMYFS